jgi:molybdopterin-guanine dinucleotide biosynthesis protein B
MPAYKAIAFTGPSGSGKTTLVEKIAQHLVATRQIAIIKHDPSDKAIFDQEGKDSDRFYKTGADVAVVSDTRTTLFSHRYRQIETVAAMFGSFDLLMVEGLKTLPLPRLAIFRHSIEIDYLPVVQAIAIDDSIRLEDYPLPDHLTVLDLNDVGSIIEWIDEHAITLKGKI